MNKRRILNRKENLFLPIITFVIIGILFFLSYTYTEKWNFKWTAIRTEVKDSIIKLDNYGEITSKTVGYDGRTPIQWYRQQWIIENATTSELLELTDYPSGTVKAIAYEALIRKPEFKDKYKLLQKSLNDTLTFVHYQFGSVGSGSMLSDYVINFVADIENLKPPRENSENFRIELKK